MWAKLYYKTNKKAKTVLCSVIKHSRKWREHSRSREKHSPAARVHPTLLSCSRHFLACFITEQSTVLDFLFVKHVCAKYERSRFFDFCRRMLDVYWKSLLNTERAYKRIMGSILLALFGKFKCRGNNVCATFEQLETFPLTEYVSLVKNKTIKTWIITKKLPWCHLQWDFNWILVNTTAFMSTRNYFAE